MSQIGSVKIGSDEVPVFEIDDFESTVYSNYRIALSDNYGAIPFIDDLGTASYDSVRAYIEDRGVCAAHNQPIIENTLEDWTDGLDHYGIFRPEKFDISSLSPISGTNSLQLYGTGNQNQYATAVYDSSSGVYNPPQRGDAFRFYIMFNHQNLCPWIYIEYISNLESGSSRRAYALTISTYELELYRWDNWNNNEKVDLHLNTDEWYEVRIRYDVNNNGAHEVEVLDLSGNSMQKITKTHSAWTRFDHNGFKIGQRAGDEYDDNYAYVGPVSII